MAFRTRALTMAGLCLGLSACAYKPLTGSSIGYKISGSLKSEAAGAGESNLFVHGWLLRPTVHYDKDVIVIATSKVKESTQVVVVMPVGKSGHYGMFLPEADYELTAFIDKNADGFLDNQEIFGRRGAITSLRTSGPSVLFDVDIELQEHALSGVSVLPEKESIGELSRPDVEVGENLFAERYAADVGTLGLISPNEFLQKVSQLQFIEEPDFTDDRVPLVLVHGIDGTPQIFERLEEELDQKRFQPWFFYFPSGARLPTSAEVLHHYFFSGRVLPRMEEVALTAHSMGGLVARGALNAYKRGTSPSPLHFYGSFVTPYGGVEAANIGIRNSPFRVPSWVDVASGSEYQSHLFTGLPRGTNFHLIAGNSEGEGDGTIALSSQRFAPAASEAASIEVFPRDHVGIMTATDALAAYFRHLAPLARDISVERPLESLERKRRAVALFSAIESRLRTEGIEMRISRITGTCRRLTLKQGQRSVVVQLAVGRGLRAEIISPVRRSHEAGWPRSPAPPLPGDELVTVPPPPGEELVTAPPLPGEQAVTPQPWTLADRQLAEMAQLSRGEFTEALMGDVRELLGDPVSERNPAAPSPPPLPPAPHVVDPTPPPMHLFLGVAGTLNPGEQYLTLRVPVELAMYWGAMGMGTDVRLPMLSPVIHAEGGDLTFKPFGIAAGPRLRFGDKDAVFVSNVGLNIMTEFGRVRMTAPGGGRPLATEDLIDETVVGGVGLSGSGHAGFRISQDFYFRIGGDFGSLIQPLRVRIGDEEVILFQRPFLNILGGLEVRIP